MQMRQIVAVARHGAAVHETCQHAESRVHLHQRAPQHLCYCTPASGAPALLAPYAVGDITHSLQASPPDAKTIPKDDIVGMTVILLTCSYRESVRCQHSGALVHGACHCMIGVTQLLSHNKRAAITISFCCHRTTPLLGQLAKVIHMLKHVRMLHFTVQLPASNARHASVKEFLRVGYYLTNDYEDPALMENHPETPQIDKCAPRSHTLRSQQALLHDALRTTCSNCNTFPPYSLLRSSNGTLLAFAPCWQPSAHHWARPQAIVTLEKQLNATNAPLNTFSTTSARTRRLVRRIIDDAPRVTRFQNRFDGAADEDAPPEDATVEDAADDLVIGPDVEGAGDDVMAGQEQDVALANGAGFNNENEEEEEESEGGEEEAEEDDGKGV